MSCISWGSIGTSMIIFLPSSKRMLSSSNFLMGGLGAGLGQRAPEGPRVCLVGLLSPGGRLTRRWRPIHMGRVPASARPGVVGQIWSAAFTFGLLLLCSGDTTCMPTGSLFLKQGWDVVGIFDKPSQPNWQSALLRLRTCREGGLLSLSCCSTMCPTRRPFEALFVHQPVLLNGALLLCIY